jgi:cytochrome P450
MTQQLTLPPKTGLRDIANHDPWGLYDELRATGQPVVWDDSLPGWVALDRTTCAAVLGRADLFKFAYKDLPGGTELLGSERHIETVEGEDHLRIHGYLMKLIDRSFVKANKQTLIRPVVDMLIGRFDGDDRVDLGAAYAHAIPVRVGMRLLGVSTGDAELDYQLADRLRTLRGAKDQWQQSEGANPVHNRAAAEAANELRGIFMPYIRERRDEPRDDLISELWKSGPSVFPDWDENDIFSACITYFAGGSTQRLIRNVLFLLVHRPDIQEAVRARPAEVTPRLVEETLRAVGVYQWLYRVATADVELGGVTVKKGDRVYPAIAVANRDPEDYDCPGEIRLDAKRKKHHLAFGYGERYCIGAELGLGEATEAVNALIDRFDVLVPDEDAEPPVFAGVRARGYAPLHVRLR